MQEGDTELGGLQVPHGDVNSSTSVSGTQPAISESSQISQPTPIATPMPSTPPSAVSQTTPIPQPQPTTQSSQPADQLISQTFTTFSTQNKPSTQPPMSNFDTPHAASNFTEIANSRVSSSLPQSMQSQPQPQPRSQFPTQPSPITSDSRDVMLSSTAPKKSKKGLIITVSILLIMVCVGLGLWLYFGFVNNSDTSLETSSTKPLSSEQEIYSALFDFDSQYYSPLLEYYNFGIGLKPDFKMTNQQVLFPLENSMDFLLQNLNNTQQAYDDIADSIPSITVNKKIDLQPVKNKISQSLQAMNENLDIINRFYVAFILPIEQESTPDDCSKTQAIIDLETGNTKDAAEKYYIVYCKTIQYLNNPDSLEIFQENIASQTAEAAALLNSLLIEVPSADDSLKNIYEELK